MRITFPLLQAWDGSRTVFAFPAEQGGTRINCAISWEALQDNFMSNAESPIDCFMNHRSTIEAVAERLISQRRFEQDGSILVRSADCS